MTCLSPAPRGDPARSVSGRGDAQAASGTAQNWDTCTFMDDSQMDYCPYLSKLPADANAITMGRQVQIRGSVPVGNHTLQSLVETETVADLQLYFWTVTYRVHKG